MKSKKMVTTFNKADLLRFAQELNGKRDVTMKDVHEFIGRGGSTKFEDVVEGQTLKYGDCIHHTTETKFPFVQRIKQLLGAPVVIQSKIYTEDDCSVIKTTAIGVHMRLFPRLTKNGKTQFVQLNQ